MELGACAGVRAKPTMSNTTLKTTPETAIRRAPLTFRSLGRGFCWVGPLVRKRPGALPLCSVDNDWRPARCALIIGWLAGVDSADAMLVFRNAVKQVRRRRIRGQLDVQALSGRLLRQRMAPAPLAQRPTGTRGGCADLEQT